MCITGKPAPIITYLVPAQGGSVRLEWDLSHYMKDVKRIISLVVQWQQSPVRIQWKRLAKDCNYTFLEGNRYISRYRALKECGLYNDFTIMKLYFQECKLVSYITFLYISKKPVEFQTLHLVKFIQKKRVSLLSLCI